jgi:hypothetical protein
MLITLTKIEERTDAEVPRNTPVGDIRDGVIEESMLPEIGKGFVFRYEYRFGGRITSVVTDILEPWDGNRMKFRTLNSVYELKLRKESEVPK